MLFLHTPFLRRSDAARGGNLAAFTLIRLAGYGWRDTILASAFCRLFWLLFIGVVDALGVGLAMLAGMLFALGDRPSGVVAATLGAACALLCGAAESARRGLPG